MEKSISNKIELLNQTTLDSLAGYGVVKIVEQFTETSLKILDADFGFAWWLRPKKTKYHLMYKSANTPYEPELPRERGGNFEANKTRLPFFVEQVIKENYEEGFDVSMYMKSYVIIPIAYDKNIYGSIVICFKKQHTFSGIDRQLALSLGNAAARSIAVHDFIEKDHQNVLDLAKRQAELDEERRRAQFMANATHELRTPLAIIKGNIDLALQGKEKSFPKVIKTLDAIDHEVEHLSGLISDMTTLLITPDAPPEKDFVFTRLKLRKLIEHTIRRCQTLARKKHMSLEISTFPDIQIRGDELYLDKLFTNLIKNAIVFGKNDGYVRVSAVKNKDMADILIQDNGWGIAANDLPHIFERFYRSAKARAESSDGVGLGLPIVQWIAETHGGTVSATSVENKGSTFKVSLPLDK